MARTTATNFSGGLQFPYATAATDVFKKEDVQTLAQAVDQHDHTAGKGHSINTVPANASITNAMLGSDVARANLLTNPSFEIWQRGVGPYTATGAFTADRWQLNLNGGDTASVSRTNTGQVASVYGAVLITTHSAGAVDLMQTLKTSEESLIGKALTFSALVWANTAGVSLILARDGTGGGSAQSIAHPGNSTWQTLSITAAIPGDATYVQCHFWIVGSGTVNVDDAMLVVGSQAADYAPLHPADDLARCLRYYERVDGLVTQWIASAAGNDIRWVRHTARKAVTPTVTKNGTWTVSGTGQPSVGGPIPDGFYVLSTAASAGNPSYQSSDATMFMSSEANP